MYLQNGMCQRFLGVVYTSNFYATNIIINEGGTANGNAIFYKGLCPAIYNSVMLKKSEKQIIMCNDAKHISLSSSPKQQREQQRLIF